MNEHETAMAHVLSCLGCQEKLAKIETFIRMSELGSIKTAKKAESSRLNGLKGGRPRTKDAWGRDIKR